MRGQALGRARVAVAAVFFVNGALFASWASRVPAIRGRLGLSDGELGVALLGLAVGAVVGLPTGGALVARCGSARVVPAGLVGMSLSLAVLPWAGGQGRLAVALAALGVSNSLLDVAMNAHGVEVERGYRRQVLAGFHALFSFGGLAGAAAGGLAAAVGLGPRAHLGAVAVLLLGVGLLASGSLLPASAGDRTSARRGVARPDRTLAVLGGLALCCLLSEGVANDWSAVYVRDELHGSAGLGAAAFAGFSLTMAVARLVVDRVVGRVGRRRFLAGAGLVAGGGSASAWLSVRRPQACSASRCSVPGSLGWCRPCSPPRRRVARPPRPRSRPCPRWGTSASSPARRWSAPSPRRTACARRWSSSRPCSWSRSPPARRPWPGAEPQRAPAGEPPGSLRAMLAA